MIEERKESSEVIKLQKKYNKIYFDILQHSENIKKWIQSGRRKKGDLTKSMKRLESKYQALLSTKKQLERNGISEVKILDTINEKVNEGALEKNKHSIKTLKQLENDIDIMYSDSNIDNPRKDEGEDTYKTKSVSYKERYGVENPIDIIMENNGKRIILSRPGKIYEENNNNVKSYHEQNKTNSSSQFLIENKKERFIDKIKDKLRRPNKLSKSIASIFMAVSMLFAGAAGAGELNSNVNIDKNNVNTNSKTQSATVNKESKRESFKKSLAVKAKNTEKVTTKVNTEKTIKTKTNIKPKKQEIKTPKKEIKKESDYQNKEKKDDTYILKANTKYTEVSDGSGKVGFCSKDTKVTIYSRALVRTNKNGEKQILYYTDVGETLEEAGISKDKLEKYRKDENVKECFSVQDEKGTLLGWVSDSDLISENTKEESDYTR